MYLKTIVNTCRPAFIILTPVCVFLGVSFSFAVKPQISWLNVFLIMTGSIFAHIAVNTLNEYYDFKSGLDLITIKTPFSGGSGALPENPGALRSVLITGIASTVITILIGIYLLTEIGLQLLPIGVIGILLIVTYTQWINRYPILCLISPGLGFGVLMINGTYFILVGSFSSLPWYIPLVPFFLVNNLLLLNQYPDIKADQSIGRNTFPIAFGIKASNTVYFVFSMMAYSLIVFGVINQDIPLLSLVATLPVFLSLFAFTGALKHMSNIHKTPKYQRANVLAALLTPGLLGLAILNG